MFATYVRKYARGTSLVMKHGAVSVSAHIHPQTKQQFQFQMSTPPHMALPCCAHFAVEVLTRLTEAGCAKINHLAGRHTITDSSSCSCCRSRTGHDNHVIRSMCLVQCKLDLGGLHHFSEQEAAQGSHFEPFTRDMVASHTLRADTVTAPRLVHTHVCLRCVFVGGGESVVHRPL